VGALWTTLPLFAFWAVGYLMVFVLVFAVWCALGAYLDAQRWRARARALSTSFRQ
jgi:hypothetical protein